MFVILLRSVRMRFAKLRFDSFKDVTISKSEIESSFMRSSGPGGQSVNTTNSKAEVKLKIDECKAVDDFTAKSIRSRYKNLLNKDGEVVVRSQLHKSQGQNFDQCILKLKQIVYECSIVPKERNYIEPVESLADKEKRMFEKKRRSQIKQRRRNKFRDQ